MNKLVISGISFALLLSFGILSNVVLNSVSAQTPPVNPNCAILTAQYNAQKAVVSSAKADLTAKTTLMNQAIQNLVAKAINVNSLTYKADVAAAQAQLTAAVDAYQKAIAKYNAESLKLGQIANQIKALKPTCPIPA